jgi:protein-disulfide isomerase
MSTKNSSPEFIEINIDIKKYIVPISIIVSAILLSVALIIGFSMISKAISEISINGVGNTAEAPKVEDKYFTIRASVDDDPFVGDVNAPVTVIEFAAYDCPFCLRHATETFPSIMKDYINSGKVKYVFRDSPLAGAGSNYQANVANCVRSLAGDSNDAYLKAHEFVYQNFDAFRDTTQRTTVNQLITDFASTVGLSAGAIIECASAARFKSEIEKDQADLNAIAASMGINGLGVPSFVIGKSSADGVISAEVVVFGSGEIGGNLINGAYPYTKFVEVIDSLL